MFGSITTSVGPPISSRCSTLSRWTSTNRRRAPTLAPSITARRGSVRAGQNRRIRYPPIPSIASATTKAIRNFTRTDRSSMNSIGNRLGLRDERKPGGPGSPGGPGGPPVLGLVDLSDLVSLSGQLDRLDLVGQYHPVDLVGL